jgi:ABC-type cobalamin/Fe3+-siderophores transport system ATPase subunit
MAVPQSPPDAGLGLNASPPEEAGLALRAVTIWLGDEPLVSLDAIVPPGQTLTLMGPSGVGKSTLLAFAAGFLAPAFRAEGRVVLNGREVTNLPPQRRGIGLLFPGRAAVSAPLHRRQSVARLASGRAGPCRPPPRRRTGAL